MCITYLCKLRLVFPSNIALACSRISCITYECSLRGIPQAGSCFRDKLAPYTPLPYVVIKGHAYKGTS